MGSFIVAYLVFCLVLFLTAVYAESFESDISVKTLLIIAVTSFTPMLNVAVIMITWNNLQDNGKFGFLDKTVIKRRQ